MTIGTRSGMPDDSFRQDALPIAWRNFIRYCREMRYGEIERLSIQDGLPVLAEETKRKVKFDRGG